MIHEISVSLNVNVNIKQENAEDETKKYFRAAFMDNCHFYV